MLHPALSLRRRRRHDHPFVGTCLKPKSTYTTFMDEAFIHYRNGFYRKALYCFDRALEIQPDSKKALVQRSQCHLKLGDAANALQDAEASFDLKTTYLRGLFQYSEALFNLGKFEKALIAYYRGHRVRKNMDVFRVGVHKCRKAILSAIGSYASTQIEDLDEILPLIKEFEYLQSMHVTHCCIRPEPGEGKEYKERISILKEPSKARAAWVSHETLGELNYDKIYLQKFMERYAPDDEHTFVVRMLNQQTSEALNYIKIREAFWSHVKPMYSRKFGLNFNNKMVLQYEIEEKERQESNRRIKMDAVHGALMKNLRTIQHDLSINRPKDSLLECVRTIRQTKGVSFLVLPKKRIYMCLLYHYKGLSELMLKAYDPALRSFQMELKLTVDQPLEGIKSRALDCLGRTFVKKKLYMEAIDAWETRLSVCKVPSERACMFHELARCYYVLKKPGISINYIEMGIREASKVEDVMWLTLSYFFLAKLRTEQNDIELAYMTMEKAAEYGKHIRNKNMAKNIRQCLYCLNHWLRRTHMDDRAKQQAILRMQRERFEVESETLDVPEEDLEDEPEPRVKTLMAAKHISAVSSITSISGASAVEASHGRMDEMNTRFQHH